MRCIADMHPGAAKTDEEDATLGILIEFDPELARQITPTNNRIRGLFTQIHPRLERVIGLRLEHDAVLEVVSAWPTPAQLKHAVKARIDAKLKKHGASRYRAWATAVLEALDHQSVIIVGTDAARLVIPHLARQMISLHAQLVDVATNLKATVENRPLYSVLTSMLGVSVRTAAVITDSELRQDVR